MAYSPAASRTNPELDLNTILFPTDILTVGELRKREPGGYFHGNRAPKEFHPGDTHFSKIVLYEQDLATYVFRKVIGMPEELGDVSFMQHKRELCEMYVEYGIVSDLDKAVDLLRGIENQATVQGKAFREKQARGL
jgi:hypothetical protein